MDKIFFSIGYEVCSIMKSIGLYKVCRTQNDWYNIGIVTLIILVFVIVGIFQGLRKKKMIL